jgi:hypothetical protein
VREIVDQPHEEVGEGHGQRAVARDQQRTSALVQQRDGPLLGGDEGGHAEEQRRVDGHAPRPAHSFGDDETENQVEECLGEEAQQIIRTHVLPAHIGHCRGSHGILRRWRYQHARPT